MWVLSAFRRARFPCLLYERRSTLTFFCRLCPWCGSCRRSRITPKSRPAADVAPSSSRRRACLPHAWPMSHMTSPAASQPVGEKRVAPVCGQCSTSLWQSCAWGRYQACRQGGSSPAGGAQCISSPSPSPFGTPSYPHLSSLRKQYNHAKPWGTEMLLSQRTSNLLPSNMILGARGPMDEASAYGLGISGSSQSCLVMLTNWTCCFCLRSGRVAPGVGARSHTDRFHVREFATALAPGLVAWHRLRSKCPHISTPLRVEQLVRPSVSSRVADGRGFPGMR